VDFKCTGALSLPGRRGHSSIHSRDTRILKPERNIRGSCTVRPSPGDERADGACLVKGATTGRMPTAQRRDRARMAAQRPLTRQAQAGSVPGSGDGLAVQRMARRQGAFSSSSTPGRGAAKRRAPRAQASGARSAKGAEASADRREGRIEPEGRRHAQRGSVHEEPGPGCAGETPRRFDRNTPTNVPTDQALGISPSKETPITMKPSYCDKQTANISEQSI